MHGMQGYDLELALAHGETDLDLLPDFAAQERAPQRRRHRDRHLWDAVFALDELAECHCVNLLLLRIDLLDDPPPPPPHTPPRNPLPSPLQHLPQPQP